MMIPRTLKQHMELILHLSAPSAFLTNAMLRAVPIVHFEGKHALERPAGAVPIFPCRHWLVRELLLRNQPVSYPATL